jgi:RNase P subunit RPR2
MTCIHLRKLYSLCEKERLRITSSDLVTIVCKQCGHQEECPSLLMEEYETQHPDEADCATPGNATPERKSG